MEGEPSYLPVPVEIDCVRKSGILNNSQCAFGNASAATAHERLEVVESGRSRDRMIEVR